MGGKHESARRSPQTHPVSTEQVPRIHDVAYAVTVGPRSPASCEEHNTRADQTDQNDDPDSLRIFLLSEELGAIQVRMTKQATSQYLQIRAICKPGQRQKLSNVYCDLFGCSRVKMGKGQGQGQHRNHQGRK